MEKSALPQRPALYYYQDGNVLTAQGQCFMHFGMSAEWLNAWRDFVSRTQNPKA